jgi:chromate transport protein
MNLISLFYPFFKIGLFGFGGGLAMLPFIFQAAQQINDMTMQDFSNLVALSQITPGPLAVNAATYVGYNAAGFLGAAVATIGVCSPSFMIVLVISEMLEKFKESKVYEAILAAIRPATVGLVAAAGLMICKSSLFNMQAVHEIKKALQSGAFNLSALNIADAFNVAECAVFAVCIVLILKFKVSPIKLMLSVAFAALAISFI